MPIYLSNPMLELEIQEPGEEYKMSRFDWSGQITQITYKKSHTFCTNETLVPKNKNILGRGLYNEFGIDKAIGYSECKDGDLFPKIGIGMLLKEDNSDYDFFHSYKVSPANFEIQKIDDKIIFLSESKIVNGYGFYLQKEIKLVESSFIIKYYLKNIGSKPLSTNEYVHNFIAINNKLLDNKYVLKFPEKILTRGEVVNPESKILISNNQLTWESELEEQFFYSDIQEFKNNESSWQIEHLIDKVGIEETVNFTPQRANLWGNTHVVSPELFIDIDLEPNKSMNWERRYDIYEI